MSFSSTPGNISKHQNNREREAEAAQKEKDEIAKQNKRSIQDMNAKFSSVTDDVQVRVRAKTYGLVTLR